MAQLRLQPPEPFNFRNPDDWPRWKRRFEQFRVASGLAGTDAVQQISTLLYCIGEEAEAVLTSTNITAEERGQYDTVVAKFDSFFGVRRNIIFERARFNRRHQQEGETAEQYIMELYRLAENCDYGPLKDEMIRDRLVVGIRDAALSQQLQLDAELTLDKAKTKVRQREAVGEQQKELKGISDGGTNLETVRSHRPFRTKGSHPHKNREKKIVPTHRNCTRCGKESHPRDKCPAKDAICHRCNKKGHYSSKCHSKQFSEITSDTVAADTAFLGTVAVNTTSAWFTTVELNGKSLKVKIDTGAEVTAISKEAYKTLQKPQLDPPGKFLFGPSRQPLKTAGQFLGTLSYKGKEVKQHVYVVNGLKTNLLGLPAITALSLAVRTDAVETKTQQRVDETDIKKQFPSVFQGLGNLGEEFQIHLKPGAIPYSLFTPRHIPLPLRPKVKEELNRMEQMGVISKVDQPTQWCAGMVVVPKKEGAIRICVDLKPLNENVLREVHPLPKVDDTLAQLSGATIFSKLDANSGFWQIPLAKESKLLTTFITPFGRYCFNKMPFGISSAPEHFQKRMMTVLSGVEGTLCLMDDILVFGKDRKEHDERLIHVLKKIRTAGVTLNPQKCEFRKSQLKFLGHVIDREGVRADPDKTTAITEMKAPTNVSELRRFMGMVNQLGKFSPNLAEMTHPIRQLLSKKSSWLWGPAQEEAFADIKKELSKPTVLHLYDPGAPTKISADASSYGLGAVLMQKSNFTWCPVAYASRSMTETERRYAQIEKEALAVTWACEKFSTYILGMKFLIETDHKPLVPLLGTKVLDSLPPRVLRFRLRLARFDYSIVHVPGKYLYTADTLSRSPSTTEQNDHQLQEEVEVLMEVSVTNLPASAEKLDEYRKAQIVDKVCSTVTHYCHNGWPQKKNDLTVDLVPYWKARHNLTVDKNNLLLYGKRIVVPKPLRRETLEKIHMGHQGIQRCRLRANISVWWPGISQELENLVRQCPTCARDFVPHKQPMIATELPDYPWQKIATDLFHFKGATYLLVVDYFSRFPEIAKLSNTTSLNIINALKTIFSRYGIPETVVSDNGPQYSAQEFKDFAKAYNFTHITSSPHYAQSNGQAERTVRTVKKLLREASDPHLALLTYRSTPFAWCNLSPAELLMGRRIRSNLPSVKDQLTPNWDFLDKFRDKNRAFKKKQKANYDRQHGARTLPPIQPESDVWITSGEQPSTGKVISVADTPRSYIVETQTGQVRRNRQHLNIVPPNSKSIDRTEPPTQEQIMTRSRTGTIVSPPDRL